MTREEEIHKAAEEFAFSDKTETPDLYGVINDFYYGAKWADENPNSKIVYTKEELIKIGFAFDLNGNIRTPEECYDSSIKYTQYRKQRYIDKTSEYLYQALNNGDIDVKNMELFIDNFKKAIG